MLKKLMTLLLALLTSMAFAAVDVNNADATQLDSIKGVGPAIAGKIVAERKSGNFKDWDDFVKRVSGIGEKSAAKLSEAGLTVNGTSFKGMAPKSDAKPAAKPAATAAPATPAAKATAAPAAPAATAAPAPAAKPTDAKAAAKQAKEDAAAAKKLAKAEKAAAAKTEKEDKAAAKKAGDDKAKPAAAKASEPAKK